MAETYVRARIDEQLKIQATEIFAKLGISMSDFIRIALTRAVLEKGVPFEMKVPNELTYNVMQDIAERHKTNSIESVFSLQELESELEKY